MLLYGVFALFDKHRRQHIPHFRGTVRQNLRLIVNHDIAVSRVELLNLVEMLLLVYVDEDATFDSFSEIAAKNLFWLIAPVTIGDNNGQSKRSQVAQRFKRVGVQSVEKWIVIEDRMHMPVGFLVQHIQRCLSAQSLEGQWDIDDIRLLTRLFVEFPEVRRKLLSHLNLKMFVYIVLDGIIVDQGIIDIE